MLKAHMQRKAKGPSKVSSQQVGFELKSKVNLALNKLADRDTYQIGADELEKTAECLTPDKISPFLSCILETDSEQKSAVRKESVRLMATLARFHQGLIVPYLSRMVASIVKRLKDPDSVVRDTCHETMGVLASKLNDHEDDNNGVFIMLVRPLFEALGEQNKYVQSGAALCLARVIDNTHDPPSSILQRMLTRTTKLLKNPHLMAKSSVIELNRSIIQAGGATTQVLLAAAMASIQEALKNSDWTTRKAASIALGDIASSGASFLGSFRASCICSLESCRFDKVKPVRDTVLNALQYWRSVPGPDTSEPSEAGSYVKENFCGGDYSDVTSNNDSGWKDVSGKKVTTNSAIRKMPLSARKTSRNHVQDPQHCKDDDWHIEISVSEKHNVSLPDVQNEESEGSTVTKTLDRIMPDTTSTQDIRYEFVPVDDKQECSSVSNLLSDNFGSKFVTVSHKHISEGQWQKSMVRNQQFAGEEISNEEEDGVCSGKIRDCRSLESAVNESSTETVSLFCSRIENNILGIHKQLLEIDSKQSNLMDLLQVFSTGIMDSMSMLQSKVLNLEHVMDQMAHDLLQKGKHPDLVNSRLEKQGDGASFSRLPSCTPRPSVDIRNRQSSLLSVKNSDVWEENALGRNRSPNCAKQETWTNHTVKFCRNSTGNDVPKSSGNGAQGIGQIRKNEAASTCSSVLTISGRQKYFNNKDGLWQHVKNLLCQGDIDSAYGKALSSGDELVLVELLDRTGPVVESLSQKNVYNILSNLVSYLLEQRFMNCVIPWLQQVVDLSAIRGPSVLIPSAKVRREILNAIQEAMNMEFSNPAERRSVTQLAIRFHREWGKCS